MEIEGGGPSLYLLEDLELPKSPRAARAYDRQAPISDVDPTQPIFDIRGSYLLYRVQLGYSSASESNLGANCYTYASPRGKLKDKFRRLGLQHVRRIMAARHATYGAAAVTRSADSFNSAAPQGRPTRAAADRRAALR
ncbi:MAG: hypothetical protein IPO66_18680 [Rhodanobacteraceae bacterium]|nr:hypothetical protein [Rhodanobacteraceae bacterium]